MEEELSHVSHAQLSFIFVEILHKHLKQQHKKKTRQKNNNHKQQTKCRKRYYRIVKMY